MDVLGLGHVALTPIERRSISMARPTCKQEKHQPGEKKRRTVQQTFWYSMLERYDHGRLYAMFK
jgi:hypothetical protein